MGLYICCLENFIWLEVPTLWCLSEGLNGVDGPAKAQHINGLDLNKNNPLSSNMEDSKRKDSATQEEPEARASWRCRIALQKTVSVTLRRMQLTFMRKSKDGGTAGALM
ncbi:hypothetical protein Landi51_09891 [Colletotrichum acutatum]